MRVNEIFYSLQGEGHFTGTPAIFVRLSGCNLNCDFCDTDHVSSSDMPEEEIVKRVNDFPAAHVVITGGEPTLQLTASLVDKLHDAGKFVQIETNGTRLLDPSLADKIDWITCSPKEGGQTQHPAHRRAQSRFRLQARQLHFHHRGCRFAFILSSALRPQGKRI